MVLSQMKNKSNLSSVQSLWTNFDTQYIVGMRMYTIILQIPSFVHIVDIIN